jgi:hypothetical protein
VKVAKDTRENYSACEGQALETNVKRLIGDEQENKREFMKIFLFT